MLFQWFCTLINTKKIVFLIWNFKNGVRTYTLLLLKAFVNSYKSSMTPSSLCRDLFPLSKAEVLQQYSGSQCRKVFHNICMAHDFSILLLSMFQNPLVKFIIYQDFSPLSLFVGFCSFSMLTYFFFLSHWVGLFYKTFFFSCFFRILFWTKISQLTRQDIFQRICFVGLIASQLLCLFLSRSLRLDTLERTRHEY